MKLTKPMLLADLLRLQGGRGSTVALFLLLTLFGLSGERLQAAEPLPSETVRVEANAAKTDDQIALGLGRGYSLLVFPAGDLYPPYAADPYRVGFGFQQVWTNSSTIANSGNKRFLLKGGATLGLLRLQPDDQPGRGVQFDIVAGSDAQFDIDNGEDVIGWDGNYGLLLTAAPTEDFAFKLGPLHTSAHVGDEYAERTGRKRLGYTRLELVSGVLWKIGSKWKTYAEYGWGYALSDAALMKPGRIQGGLEFEYPLLWQDRLRWYSAVDVSAMEERNWRVDTNVQAGLAVHNVRSTWRLGVEYHNGRPTISEFFHDDESYWSTGLWIDF